MTITTYVRILLLSILISGIALIGRAFGDGWPTNYQHFNTIRDTARSTPAYTHVMFTLNDGTQVFGELLRYEKYTDYIWYQPQGTGRNWFKQDAFDVHEIFRLDIINEPV